MNPSQGFFCNFDIKWELYRERGEERLDALLFDDGAFLRMVLCPSTGMLAVVRVVGVSSGSYIRDLLKPRTSYAAKQFRLKLFATAVLLHRVLIIPNLEPFI